MKLTKPVLSIGGERANGEALGQQSQVKLPTAVPKTSARSKTYSDHRGSVSFQKVLISSSATRKTGAPPLEIDTA